MCFFTILGLDRLLSFMIVKELQQFLGQLRKEITKELKVFIHTNILSHLSPPTILPQQSQVQ